MGHPVVTFAHSTPFPTHLPQQLTHIRARFLIGASSAPSLPSRSRKSLLPRTVIIGYCDSFITQLFNQKHCKMSNIVTNLSLWHFFHVLSQYPIITVLPSIDRPPSLFSAPVAASVAQNGLPHRSEWEGRVGRGEGAIHIRRPQGFWTPPSPLCLKFMYTQFRLYGLRIYGLFAHMDNFIPIFRLYGLLF